MGALVARLLVLALLSVPMAILAFACLVRQRTLRTAVVLSGALGGVGLAAVCVGLSVSDARLGESDRLNVVADTPAPFEARVERSEEEARALRRQGLTVGTPAFFVAVGTVLAAFVRARRVRQ